MFVFKDTDKTSTVTHTGVVHYTQNLTTASSGIESINIVSGSISESYWNSLNVLFYTSGSPRYPNEHKFSFKNSIIRRAINKQHLTKFHNYPSSSIITIPQQYYGEKIKEKTFVLVDKSFTDNSGNNPKIIDDGHGNLYSSNAYHSQSTNHESHSDNYVGNIFYDNGLAIITETGSWSGSVKYSDITKDTNFTLEFDSQDVIHTNEYSVTVRPEEFNKSMNFSLRMPLSGTYGTTLNELTASILSNPYLATEFTGSDFTPYVTTINLYQSGDKDKPVITAVLPKPIRVSNKISTTFKIRLDI